MKQFRVKGSGITQEYLTLLKERRNGFDVLITRIVDDYVEEDREYLSKELFETCLRTQYIEAVAEIPQAQTA